MSDRRRRASARAVTEAAPNSGAALAAIHATRTPPVSRPPETTSSSVRIPTRKLRNIGRSQCWALAGAVRSMRSRFISTATITSTRYIR